MENRRILPLQKADVPVRKFSGTKTRCNQCPEFLHYLMHGISGSYFHESRNKCLNGEQRLNLTDTYGILWKLISWKTPQCSLFHSRDFLIIWYFLARAIISSSMKISDILHFRAMHVLRRTVSFAFSIFTHILLINVINLIADTGLLCQPWLW